jgi:hypothetical protein
VKVLGGIPVAADLRSKISRVTSRPGFWRRAVKVANAQVTESFPYPDSTAPAAPRPTVPLLQPDAAYWGFRDLHLRKICEDLTSSRGWRGCSAPSGGGASLPRPAGPPRVARSPGPPRPGRWGSVLLLAFLVDVACRGALAEELAHRGQREADRGGLARVAGADGCGLDGVLEPGHVEKGSAARIGDI